MSSDLHELLYGDPSRDTPEYKQGYKDGLRNGKREALMEFEALWMENGDGEYIIWLLSQEYA